MLSVRAFGAVFLLSLFNFKLTTCRSPGEGGSEPTPASKDASREVTLPGVDSSSLTGREKSDWSRLVSELLAPCPDQPVSIAQCVQESRSCKACAPAAKYLVKQVSRGRSRGQIEQAYKSRFAPDQVKNIDIGDSPSKGSPTGSIVIVEFADFECPACNGARPVLDEMMKKNDGKVRLVFKHFPLSMHQHAEKAARSAVAAHKQGKFWEMHTVLFDNQEKLDEATIEKLAKQLGLDMARFQKDRDSEATADAVARDRKLGEQLTIASTPSLFINGRPFPATPEFEEDLQDWITLEFELQGGTPPASAPAQPSSLPPPSVPASAAPAPEKPATKTGSMRGSADLGCFPTGRHYPGIAHLLRIVAAGLADEFPADTKIDDLLIVAIDTETTGRDPLIDRIVEVACITYKGGQIVDRKSWLVNPGRPIPKEAFDIHGIATKR